MKKKFLVTLCAVVVFFSVGASAAQAAVLSESQMQSVLELLKSFNVDTSVVSRVENALRGRGGGTAVSVTAKPTIAMPSKTATWRHAVCNRIFDQTFTFGSKGDAVRDIQSFLREEGLFSEEMTGFFGKLTQEALGRWQAEHGLVPIDASVAANSGWGVLGPKTREQIRMWCDKGYDRFKAEPQFGTAPLSVTFSAWVGGFTPHTFAIDFGDGSAREQIACSAPADVCIEPGKVTHIYQKDGTYTAVLHRTSADSAEPEAVGKKLIHVGSRPEACTKEYKPVCGQSTGCKTLPGGIEMCAKPEPQTYGNECVMKAAGATLLYEGQCRQKPFEPAPSCKVWYDGCNDCSRATPNGPVVCTERACLWQAPGYCKEKFEEHPENKPPVISSFSGPTTLQLHETGTWTIEASDPENGALSYRILWGDEGIGRILSELSALKDEFAFTQASSFTHVYGTAGTYTVAVVVKDNKGKTAKATATVKVGGELIACTREYAPVCGQPPEPSCRKTPPYCELQTPGPTTYGNKCAMNAAGATFLYKGECKKDQPVACTADAKQCSDGTWVGRSGPNCEFKCPGSQ